MEYCPKCGNKVSDDDCFCSKCGVRTRKGVDEGASPPVDELRDALSKAGLEMEKAFSIAAKEIHRAFKTAGDNIRQSTHVEPIICPHCGEKNTNDASYCFKCGEKTSRE